MPRSVPTLRRERERLVRELAKMGRLIRGSLFQRFSTCSRSGCACHEGQRHGPRTYLSVSAGRKQRQIYVPADQVDSARQAVQQYHRLVALVERISHINLQLFKRGVRDGPNNRRARPAS